MTLNQFQVVSLTPQGHDFDLSESTLQPGTTAVERVQYRLSFDHSHPGTLGDFRVTRMGKRCGSAFVWQLRRDPKIVVVRIGKTFDAHFSPSTPEMIAAELARLNKLANRDRAAPVAARIKLDTLDLPCR
jgi:hypothetical protein